MRWFVVSDSRIHSWNHGVAKSQKEPRDTRKCPCLDRDRNGRPDDGRLVSSHPVRNTGRCIFEIEIWKFIVFSASVEPVRGRYQLHPTTAYTTQARREQCDGSHEAAEPGEWIAYLLN